MLHKVSPIPVFPPYQNIFPPYFPPVAVTGKIAYLEQVLTPKKGKNRAMTRV